MENITIKINGREVSAPQGSTILEAARLAQIEIRRSYQKSMRSAPAVCASWK